MSEQSGSGLSSVDFDAAWCATDLGKYRACRYTYEHYSLESLPPLDSNQFTGTFRWLGDAGGPVPGQVMKLNGLAGDLSARGVTLPRDFVTFQTSGNLYGSLDEVSVTGCWTDLSKPLPSPVEPGAFLVRFFRDQQDCVIWYLYLRPMSEAFVVFSDLDYEYEYEARRDGEETPTDLDDAQEQNDRHLPRLEPRLQDYLNHYAPPGAPRASQS